MASANGHFGVVNLLLSTTFLCGTSVINYRNQVMILALTDGVRCVFGELLNSVHHIIWSLSNGG